MSARHLLAVAIAVAPAAAGCGGGDGGGPAPQRRTTGAGATSPTTTTRTTATARGAIRSLDIAVRATSHYRIDIFSLRRSGPFLTLNLVFACDRADGDRYASCDGTFDFIETGVNTDDFNTMAGLRLLDPGAAREYRVVRNVDDQPYASALESSYDPGSRRYRAWVRFAAPPASVKAIDLAFPNGGPHVDGLPITEGGGVDPAPVGSGEVAAEPADFDRPPESTSAQGLDVGVDDLELEVRSRGGNERVRERAGRRTVTLATDVLFAFNRATLEGQAGGALDDVADTVARRAVGPVAIDGYTDSKGSPAYNLRLSRRRAETVGDALAQRLGAGRELRAVGHGEDDPVAPNQKNGEDNPAGRRLNRRVTIGFSVRSGRPARPSAEESGAPAPEPGPPVRSATYTTGESDRTDVGVEVSSIRRRGAMAVLYLRVTCERSTSDNCDQEVLLAQDPIFGGLTQLERIALYNTAGGISLVDPARDATYVPARGPDDLPFAAGVDLRPGTASSLWVYFAAPPPSVETMTVAMPGGGPRLTGIPVE